MLKGKRLKKGDVIGIVAPASCTDIKNLESAIKNIEARGYKTKIGKSCYEKWYTFAGTDEIRAKDIMDFFCDKEVDAIVCMRGGFGSIRLLEMLDYERIKDNPKIFIGFSDISTLHSAFQRKCNLITFHGPMAVSNFSESNYDEKTMEHMLDMLENFREETVLRNPDGDAIKTLFGGRAEGRIVGGNLVTIAADIGSEYDFDYEDSILFIEEISEPTYKIDRAISHLIISGKFKGIKGVIIGDFNKCEKDSENSYDLIEVLKDRFEKFNIPVVYNFKSGHCTPMATLPMGAKVIIDADTGVIKLIEEVVQ